MQKDWYFGRQVVRQILNSKLKVKRLYLAEFVEQKASREFLALARQKNIPIEILTAKKMDSLCKGNHQGVALEIESEKSADFKTFLKEYRVHKRSFLVLLDEIQDPQNLGAILRSAVCFGCAAVIFPKWRAAHLTPAVMKASSGAAAHQLILQVANCSYAIEQLKEKGYHIYGAAVEGTPLPEVKFEFPLALVLGNEHRGIKPLIKKNCDQLVAIPQNTTVASLNVSTAAAILFYEISKAAILS